MSKAVPAFSASACALPTPDPTAEPTPPVATCLQVTDGQALADKIASVRRLGAFYQSCIGQELDPEGSAAHAAAAALSDQAFEVLKATSEAILDRGVASVGDAVILATLLPFLSDLVDDPPPDHGHRILQGLVAGLVRLGEAGGQP
jgi:hypothetical protein